MRVLEKGLNYKMEVIFKKKWITFSFLVGVVVVIRVYDVFYRVMLFWDFGINLFI